MEKRENSKGLSFFFLTLMVVATIFLLSGCPGPGTGSGGTTSSMIGSVTSLENIPSNDPAYVLTLFRDEELAKTLLDVVSIFQDLQSQATKFGLKTLESFSKSFGNREELMKSLKQVGENVLEELEGIDAIIEWCEREKTKRVIDKARVLLTTIDPLFNMANRYEYCVEIKDEAKIRILQNFGKSDNLPLFFDFRDAIFIVSLLRTIVFVYDMKDFWKDLKNQISGIPFTIGYMTFISSPSPENFSLLPKISSPYDVFDMRDVFVDSFLKFRGFGKMVENMDKQVLYFREIYDFEVLKTNDNGYRKDGKRTLYQLFFGEPQKISFVRDAGKQSLSDFGIRLSDLGIVSLKVGGLQVTNLTKMIDLIREIDRVLPTSTLTIEVNHGATESGFKSSGNIKISFDFSKIASKDPFDFKVNNLGIKSGFFREEVYQSIIEAGSIPENVDDPSVFLGFSMLSDEYADFFTMTISGLKVIFEFNVDIENGAIKIYSKLEYEQQL